MNYDSLTSAYRTVQRDRVVRAARRILEGDDVPTPGRVVPGDEDLVLGTGRVLRLSVLFLDISGFSARASSTPEQQHNELQVLNLFLSEMVRVAIDYGGTIEKNTGDGLMAYFEDEPGSVVMAGQRAVAAALTMMFANETVIGPILTEMGLDPVRFRIGIDVGTVTIARLGVARSFNANVAIGVTANIASKILVRAGPGEIVVGEEVLGDLPSSWHQYVVPHGDSGFVYLPSNQPYPLYRYTGEWTR